MGRDARSGAALLYEGGRPSVLSVIEAIRAARGGDPILEADKLIDKLHTGLESWEGEGAAEGEVPAEGEVIAGGAVGAQLLAAFRRRIEDPLEMLV